MLMSGIGMPHETWRDHKSNEDIVVTIGEPVH